VNKGRPPRGAPSCIQITLDLAYSGLFVAHGGHLRHRSETFSYSGALRTCVVIEVALCGFGVSGDSQDPGGRSCSRALRVARLRIEARMYRALRIFRAW